MKETIQALAKRSKALYGSFSENAKETIQALKETLRALSAYSRESAREISTSFYVVNGILLIIIVWAGYYWLRMLTVGAGITGSSDAVPWGLFIVSFVFFVGASAGATIIGLMIYAFNRNDYKPLGTRAIVVGILCLMAAVLNLSMDVGAPLRTLLIPWFLRNMSSMLIYTTTTYFLFGSLLAAELYFAVKIALGSKDERDMKIAKWLAIFAVPFALVILVATEGVLFAVVKARELWHTTLLPPHFAVSALVTGTSIMILLPILTAKVVKREIVGLGTLDHLGKLLAYFIAITIFMDFFDLFVLKYSEEPEGLEILHLLTGRFSVLFVLNAGGLLAALIILMSKKGRTVRGLTIVATVALVAVMAYRYILIVVAQMAPLYPWQPEIYYYPTLPEVTIEVAIIALVVLLYTMITKFLPMEEVVHKSTSTSVT